jgi:GDP-L-fucose synthase
LPSISSASNSISAKAQQKVLLGFEGNLEHDLSKPDGTPRKLMDVSKLKAAGWTARIGLREGIERVYESLSGEDWY